MEIKPVTEKLSLEYPKQEKVGIDKLKVNIPSVWMKAGITLGVFKIMMMDKVLATPTEEVFELACSHSQEYSILVASIFNLFNFLVLIILSVSMLFMKLRTKKVNRKFKIAFLVFVILLLIGMLSVELNGSNPILIICWSIYDLLH